MCLLAPHFRGMTKTEKYSVQRVLRPPKMALLPLPFRAKEFQLVYTHLSVTSFRVFAKIVENLLFILTKHSNFLAKKKKKCQKRLANPKKACYFIVRPDGTGVQLLVCTATGRGFPGPFHYI
jgi:hypothetical protein